MYNRTSRHDDFFGSTDWKTAVDLFGIRKSSRKSTVNSRVCAIAHTGQTGIGELVAVRTPNSKCRDDRQTWAPCTASVKQSSATSRCTESLDCADWTPARFTRFSS